MYKRQGLDRRRLELRPAQFPELADDVVPVAVAAVAPVGAHGVQRIGDADDPDHLRQLPAFQPGGVAFAVEPLVVVAGTAVGLRQKFQPLENFSAPDGVLDVYKRQPLNLSLFVIPAKI